MEKVKQMLKKEKGFTLVEILVVIAIIAILFMVLLPQIDKAVHKTRVNNVKNDIRAFQQMTHSYLLNTRGVNSDQTVYNKYLDQNLMFDVTTKESLRKDPWGSPYYLRDFGKKVVITSSGPDEQRGTADDLLLAMYASSLYIDHCTIGFEPNELTLKTATFVSGGACGDDVQF